MTLKRGWLEAFAPHEPIPQYLHNRTGEDNADAHLKRQVVAITKGKLDFGPWELKRVLVKIIGE